MKTLISAAAIAAAMLATPAFAAGVTGSLGYSNYAIDDADLDGNLGAITGRIGTMFSPNFGAELEASIGVSDETVDVLGYDVDLSLSHSVGVFLVGAVPVNDSFDLFGRVGASTAEVEAEVPSISGLSVDASGSGFEIGGGGRYFFGGGNHGLRAEYTYSDTISSHVFSVGYAFRFGGE